MEQTSNSRLALDIFQKYHIVVTQNEHSEKILQHCQTTGNTARAIAEKTKTIDPDEAYVCGVMHDVGRFYLGENEIYKHPFVGYELLKDQNLDIANVCLSHPFPVKNMFEYIISYCQQDKLEAEKISKQLESIEITDCMKLIQLCDKLSAFNSNVTLETKFQWYAKREKINESLSQPMYDAYVALKQHFEAMTGYDIYGLLGLWSKHNVID